MKQFNTGKFKQSLDILLKLNLLNLQIVVGTKKLPVLLKGIVFIFY